MVISANTTPAEFKSIKIGDFVRDARYAGKVIFFNREVKAPFVQYTITVAWTEDNGLKKTGNIYAKR